MCKKKIMGYWTINYNLRPTNAIVSKLLGCTHLSLMYRTCAADEAMQWRLWNENEVATGAEEAHTLLVSIGGEVVQWISNDWMQRNVIKNLFNTLR